MDNAMNVRTVVTRTVPVIDFKATGQNIKTLRKSAGISVRDLQAVLGFTNPQAIYKWQNGDSLPLKPGRSLVRGQPLPPIW